MGILKFFVKFVLFFVLDCICFQQGKNERKLAVIRLDAIGDFCLFVPFLKQLRVTVSPDSSCVYVGNAAYKSLYEKFCTGLFDECVWISRPKFNRNLLYRIKILRQLSGFKFDTLIHPTYSRDFFYGDWISHFIKADHKIASVGDNSNLSYFERFLGDKFYDEFVPATADLKFEFYRNKEFCENLLNRKVVPESFKDILISDRIVDGDYIVFFVGASSSTRRWSLDNWEQLKEKVLAKYNGKIVLCGGPAELEISQKLNCLNERVISLVGKTSLAQLVDVLRCSSFVVSNETSVPHICAMFDVPVIVISNGNHFGRFNPYPKEIAANYECVYPKIIADKLADLDYLKSMYGRGSSLDINSVTVDSVWNVVNEYINKSRRLNLRLFFSHVDLYLYATSPSSCSQLSFNS